MNKHSTLLDTAELMRVLGEPTRLRLALVLDAHSLSVAELTELTGLAQSRISSHLARMRKLGLLDEERQGTASLQRLRDPLPDGPRQLLKLLQAELAGLETERDLETAATLVKRRRGRRGWAAQVAGEMEKHYSPGRGWEVSAQVMAQLLSLGEVLDIAAGDGVIAQMLAPRAERVTCVDLDATVARAGRDRLHQQQAHNTCYLQADMHALPFPSHHFDTVLHLHALSYSEQPQRAIAEAQRMLKPGGVLILATLDAHQHTASVAPYDHRNNGFSGTTLAALLQDAGLKIVSQTQPPVRETRPPYHLVHVVRAQSG